MAGHRPDVPGAPARVAERLLAQVCIDDQGCWLLPHARGRGGYVKIGWSDRGRKQTNMGHIVLYEHVKGSVPAGLTLDHLCRNRACVNPDHLEAVAEAENLRRSPIAPATINTAKTHCPAGHAYTPENTYVFPSGRSCKTCMNDRQRRRRTIAKATR